MEHESWGIGGSGTRSREEAGSANQNWDNRKIRLETIKEAALAVSAVVAVVSTPLAFMFHQGKSEVTEQRNTLSDDKDVLQGQVRSLEGQVQDLGTQNKKLSDANLELRDQVQTLEDQQASSTGGTAAATPPIRNKGPLILSTGSSGASLDVIDSQWGMLDDSASENVSVRKTIFDDSPRLSFDDGVQVLRLGSKTATYRVCVGTPGYLSSPELPLSDLRAGQNLCAYTSQEHYVTLRVTSVGRDTVSFYVTSYEKDS